MSNLSQTQMVNNTIERTCKRCKRTVRDWVKFDNSSCSSFFHPSCLATYILQPSASPCCKTSFSQHELRSSQLQQNYHSSPLNADNYPGMDIDIITVPAPVPNVQNFTMPSNWDELSDRDQMKLMMQEIVHSRNQSAAVQQDLRCY